MDRYDRSHFDKRIQCERLHQVKGLGFSALLMLSCATCSAASAQDGISASDLEMLCVSEDAGDIKGCVSYIMGSISVMRTICDLQHKGKVSTKGFLALDIPETADSFDAVDTFLKSMDVSEFRHEWGAISAELALFFAISEKWPCVSK